MEIKIRKAVKSDAEFIIEFNENMARETEDRVLPHEIISAGVKNLFENPEYGFYIVAENHGKVVACLMITKEWSDWRNGLFWWIQSVYVISEFRRKGIYKKMYEWVKSEAVNDNSICGYRLYVEKENQIAQSTYKNLGMLETDYKLFEELK